ncbi:MAG TPA: PadR family transcriptional regulator [Clostridia bacterium]|nr:PadR family transcriptional regulator [Clostridia bacterium]HQA98012.1 PadR family transcriptional regulator [Clostridia bacterium]
MDIQLKRGVLEACVLKLLTRADSYGYELVKEAAQIIPLSETALYPVLRRLEAAGQVDSYRQEHAGRLRKYYRVTEAGRQAIEDFLREWEQINKVYMFIREGRP